MRTKFSRRFLCTVGAAVVALAMVVGGVFAWADSSQHKTNVVTGGNLHDKPDVVLIEDFEEPNDWREGEELKKEVWIKNTGDTQLYVRLQLKEYMDISNITYSYSEEYLLVDTDGKFVASTGTSAAERTSFKLALDNMGLTYDDSQIVTLRAYSETADRFYLATSETTNINGKYGKRLLLDYNQAAPRSLVEGVVRGSYEETIDHKNHPTSECLYTPHLWNDPPEELGNCGQGDDGGTPAKGFHDYIEWLLGTPLIKLADWDGQPVAAWTLDDTSEQGWAYWGEALRPGESTAKLLESIKLLQQPEGPFHYAIHVDMDAADLYQLASTFDGMPDKVNDAYQGKTGFSISANKQSFTKNDVDDGYIKFTASWNGTALSAGEVEWSVTGLTVDSVGPYTRFATTEASSTPGSLTIGGGQPEGRLLITATYVSPEGLKTSQYVITIKPKP